MTDQLFSSYIKVTGIELDRRYLTVSNNGFFRIFIPCGGDRRAADEARLAAAERFAAVAEGIAAGDDIIDEQDPLSFDAFFVDQLKGAVEIGLALRVFELMLFLCLFHLDQRLAAGYIQKG